MKTHIRRREKNSELIIVFGGWGTDQNAFLPLCTDDHDLILYYNYSADEPLVLADFKSYKHIVLIAWSLGVWAAEYFSSSMNFKPDLSIAINGTPVPVDDKYGIPLSILEGTLNNINETGIEKYNFRIFGNKTNYENNLDKVARRSVKSFSDELRWLYNRIMETPDSGYNWTIALTCTEDRVFPYANMIKYWKNRSETRHLSLPLPHYPFFKWKSFNEMINYLLAETEAG
ncbi:MAG TPA: pimeloyl-ACP methyl esterase BioG family protein [Bacteroidales bacterium]|nr:pimeloyl-ACP methyl esterase BioG family protein [Bacteroidales bacterium]